MSVATAEALRRSRRRANRAGQIVAVVVGFGGLCVVVGPVLARRDARRVVLGNPFPDRRVAKTVETSSPDGTRTVETTFEGESAFDQALAGGGAVLLRLGIVAAAAFIGGATAQRAYLAHFALELGPIKLPDLPETAEASRDAVLELTARLDAQDRLIESGSLATERAILALISEQVSAKEEFVRASQTLREQCDSQRRTLDALQISLSAGDRWALRRRRGGGNPPRNPLQE